jgi:hypothetical protein
LIKAIYSSVARKLLYPLAIFKHLFSINELKQAKPSLVMLICHDADRGFVWEGKRYAQLLDSINDRLIALGIETISVSCHFSKKFNRNYRNPINVNGLMARALLWRKFQFLFLKIHPDKDPTVRAWDSLLYQIKPKLIIGIQPSAELCIAAKVKGIWVADLQHGVLSGEGYYGLSYRKSFDQSGWPSCILCWNHASLTWVKNNSGGHTRALIIGNPWFIRFINRSASDQLASSMLIHPLSALSNRLKILITPQWGVFFEQHRPTGLPGGLLSFIKQGGQGYDWWIRVHPVMLNDIGRDKFFSALKKEFSEHPNVSWEYATDLPLPQILAQVDLHVTLSSAVTIEASWFGIPTALLGDNVSDLMKWFGSEIKDGYAKIIKAEHKSIDQWIHQYAKTASKESRVATMKEDLLNNFINAVNVCVNTQERIEDLLELN